MSDVEGRGPILRTVGWLLVSVAGLGVIGRSGIKAGVIRQIGFDDVFIWLAFLFFVGQVVCVHLEVNVGLGQHMDTLTSDEIDKALKLDWAQDLLFMAVYGFAKLSVVSLLRRFTLGKRDRFLLYCFEWFLAFWTICAEAVWCFECHLPRPWDYLHETCINRTIWITCFEAVNVVTDMMLIIMPSLVILSLKAPLKRRIISASFFMARIIILPASVARIYFWVTKTQTDDVSYDLYYYMISVMLVCALEILAGCILYLQPLFQTLESGFMWGGDLRRRGQGFEPEFNWDHTKGGLPFTRMRIPYDELLTGRNTEYTVEAKGPDLPSLDDEKEVVGVEFRGPPPHGIHMDRTVYVHTSPYPMELAAQPTPPAAVFPSDVAGLDKETGERRQNIKQESPSHYRKNLLHQEGQERAKSNAPVGDSFEHTKRETANDTRETTEVGVSKQKTHGQAKTTENKPKVAKKQPTRKSKPKKKSSNATKADDSNPSEPERTGTGFDKQASDEHSGGSLLASVFPNPFSSSKNSSKRNSKHGAAAKQQNRGSLPRLEVDIPSSPFHATPFNVTPVKESDTRLPDFEGDAWKEERVPDMPTLPPAVADADKSKAQPFPLDTATTSTVKESDSHEQRAFAIHDNSSERRVMASASDTPMHHPLTLTDISTVDKKLPTAPRVAEPVDSVTAPENRGSRRLMLAEHRSTSQGW